ncbi:MAG: hypothetical protein WA005_14635 [Candidatus Binataceae bacterium]
MTFPLVAALLVVGVAIIYIVVPIALDTYMRFRGPREVTCPETKEPVRIQVDARYAAATAATGLPKLRLAECTRWPQRGDCNQDCVEQLPR